MGNIDINHIQQVILNICNNAIASMPAGGTFTISSSLIDIDETCTARDAGITQGKYCLIRISDTGKGISDEARSHIFDPFFSTKDTWEGSASGPFISDDIVKNHGGVINVSSESDQGTTINIYLPCAKDIAGEHNKKRDEPDSLANRKTILIVDDEYMVLKLTKKYLEASGYAVLTADNGAKALKLYAKHIDDIDVVVLDIVLPDMDSRNVLAALKEINPAVKTILSSGYGIDEVSARFPAEGFDEFVQKPFSLAELSKKIRKITDAD